MAWLALRWSIFAGLAIWMATLWVHGARAIIRFYSPLPYWDYWNTVGELEGYRHFDLAVLWRQHNEHRVFFPNAIFALDYILFRGREVLPIVFSALFYLGTWLLLSAALYRSEPALFVRLCGIALAGIIIGWEGSALLIASPFLVQWTLSLFAATLSLFLLARVRTRKHPSAHLTAAIASAVVCTYSSANGLLLWPVLLVAGFLLRLSRKQLASLVFSAIAFIALYFVNYRFSQGSGVSAGLHHPLMFFGFVATYLAMPVPKVGIVLGVLVGVVSLAVFGALVALAAKRKILNTEAGVVLLGFYLVGLLTAATTGMGRLDPQDSTFYAATAHRYIVVPLVNWAALILAVTWLLGYSRRYLWAPALGLFAATSAFAMRSPRLGSWLDQNKDALSDCQLASLGFEAGLDDSRLMKDVYPDPSYVKQMLPVLRESQLSTFASGRTEWLGRPASSVFSQITPQQEAGAVANVYPMQTGLLVTGWTSSPRSISHPEQLVFLNDKKQIVGFGRKWLGRWPQDLRLFNAPASRGWIGFVNLNIATQSFSAYAVDAHSRALASIGKMNSVPPIRMLRAEQAGPAISGVHWDVQGSWIRDGPFPVAPLDMPSSISYFESWAGSDANSGSLTSTAFDRPAGGCLVMEGAHGPATEGLSIQLVDADTAEIIASAPLMDRDLAWKFWQVNVRPGAKRLQMIARDDGRGWGEWLTVGEPHECK